MVKSMSNQGSNGRLIIVSGPRGSGKTTLLQAAVVRLHTCAKDIAGVLSLPVIEDGMKVAIDGLDLRSGETRRLAIRNSGMHGSLITNQWHFNRNSMQWADDLLEVSTPCDLLVVDELGILEFYRGQGWLAGLKALDHGLYQAAIVVIRPELLVKAQQRWQTTKIIEVTENNRPSALEELVTLTMIMLQVSPSISFS
jgi:nucleoside-triphosphatase THEP1